MSDHISGSLAVGDNTYAEVAQQFIALQYSLYMCCFVCVLGGGFFLCTALFIQKDRALTEKAVKQGLADATATSEDLANTTADTTAASTPQSNVSIA